ncbi:MAG: sugar fermentation stimulation protein A [Candidatus Tokpelaia sp. JSC189]|nr:MAG: sugar fermentation stimulation protein A [Candidatus Tokpelaia sp. JSC189]
MFFSVPLISGKLIRRYKRFLADVILDDGNKITASVPNTGSMLGLTEAGMRVWLSQSNSPTRKYRHRLEIVETQNTLVGINTSLPNRIGEEALRVGLIPSLCGYDYNNVLREQRYHKNSRIDLLLPGKDSKNAFIEIKNVHYVRTSRLAEFPDTVTARGAKHLAALSHVVQEGHRGIMLFVIQRNDCDRLAICNDLDPFYGQQFSLARKSGIEAYAIRCKISIDSITAEKSVSIMGI